MIAVTCTERAERYARFPYENIATFAAVPYLEGEDGSQPGSAAMSREVSTHSTHGTDSKAKKPLSGRSLLIHMAGSDESVITRECSSGACTFEHLSPS